MEKRWFVVSTEYERGFVLGRWSPTVVAFTAYARPSKNKRMRPLVTHRMEN